MKEIEAIIERASDGTYSIYCKDEIFSGMGATIDEAKSDMSRQMTVYRETAISEGFKYPDYLDTGFNITYTVDAGSLLKYYIKSGMFTLATMSRITGINQKQLWAYTNGTKPRNAQAQRIRNGLYSLSKDLNSVFF